MLRFLSLFLTLSCDCELSGKRRSEEGGDWYESEMLDEKSDRRESSSSHFNGLWSTGWEAALEEVGRLVLGDE